MIEPKLRPFGVLQVPVYYRLGAPCARCGRVFRNEQGLGSHTHYRHRGRTHE